MVTVTEQPVPFAILSRRPRDLFDILRDPDGGVELHTMPLLDSRGWRCYRTYLYERRNHIRTIIQSYSTVSAAITGHGDQRLKLWGY